MWRMTLAVVLACLCGSHTASFLDTEVPQPQRPPVFRAGALFVKVDAYPSRDGRIVEGLTADDFEILEDGKPQAIDTFQFITFDAFATDADRRDPNSQRDAFALAANPEYRVFVLYLDAYHVDFAGSHRLREPLVNMLKRILGPRDLFGMLTPRQRPQDLILGRQTNVIEEQLGHTNVIWGLQGRYEPEPEEMELEACFGSETLKDRRRLDKVMSDLEALVELLGDLRQERKNILVFSRGWMLPGPTGTPGSRYVAPPVGITKDGTLTLGTSRRGAPNTRWCQDEALRISNVDFGQRFRDLLRSARQANVAFYPVNPSGLEAPGEGLSKEKSTPFIAGPPPNRLVQQLDDIDERTDHLLELATNTEGVAVVNSNDLNRGLRRIANDLAAYYVLGYYTTNTKWDGGNRRITVRLKGSGEAVRARREYRAPTGAEMAGLRAAMTERPAAVRDGAAVTEALGDLARLQPSTTLLARGSAAADEIIIAAEITAAAIGAGRWKTGGDVLVIVSGGQGEHVGDGRGRIEPGSSGTVVRVPLAGSTGSWTASVRLRGSGEDDQFDRIRIPAASGLLADPIAYRATSAQVSPVGAFQFRRTERLRVDWPVLQPVDRSAVRLLGRDGQPLAPQIALGERDVAGGRVLEIELPLAPFAPGDYVIEVTAEAGSARDKKLLAFRVVR